MGLKSCTNHEKSYDSHSSLRLVFASRYTNCSPTEWSWDLFPQKYQNRFELGFFLFSFLVRVSSGLCQFVRLVFRIQCLEALMKQRTKATGLLAKRPVHESKMCWIVPSYTHNIVIDQELLSDHESLMKLLKAVSRRYANSPLSMHLDNSISTGQSWGSCYVDDWSHTRV